VTLDEAYSGGSPLVVLADGSLRSAVVALVATSKGVWYMDAGWFDTMPSRSPDHFVEGEITGEGPWQCGDRHVFVSPAADAAEYEAWRILEDLDDGNLAMHRALAEEKMKARMR